MSLLLHHLFILFMIFLLNHDDSSATTIESATHSIFQKAVAELQELEKNLTKDQEQLNNDRQEFDEEIKQMQKSVENMDVIRLNVGGQLIMTTRETLTCAPKSILGMMFNGRWQHKLPIDQEGNIFLNFNSILFRHLLDQLQILETDNPMIFHPPFIPSLVKPFNQMLQKLGLNSSLSSEDSIITRNVGGQTVTNRQKTTTRFSESNFTASMTSSDITKSNNNNSIFLDYDPQVFQHLIARLRGESSKSRCFPIAPSDKDRKVFQKMLLDLGVDRSPVCPPNIAANARWTQNGITVAGGNESGNSLKQLSYPYGLYVDDNQTIYVTEWSNNRIMEWKSGATSGQVVAGGNGQGNRTDQLSNPTDVIVDKESDSLIICDRSNKRVMRWPRQNGTRGETIISDIDCRGLARDKDGYLYTSDHSKHEIKRWNIGDSSGTLVAGGNGEGNRLDQLSYPYYIFVDSDQSVYVSDLNNHRVMKWMKDAKEGIVVAGGNGRGNGSTQLSGIYGVFTDQLGSVYVADHKNDRVMRWTQGARQGTAVVSGNGAGGGQAKQLLSPIGIAFDRQNNLYVVDYAGHRVQKFNIELNSNT